MIGQKGVGIGKMGGGVETHVAALSSALAARGHRITIYARPKYASRNLVLPEGVEVRERPTVYAKNTEAIVHAFLCTLDAMWSSANVLHYHGVGPALMSWMPRLFTPWKRVIVTFHSQDRFHAKWGRIARTMLHVGEWMACHIPHATIAVSHVLQLVVRRLYHRQAIYIPNGTDVQSTPASDQLAACGLKPESYILNVSRLVPHKAQHVLIEAFLQVKRAGKSRGMKLALVGESSYTPGYTQRLHALADNDEDIVFLGFQFGERLRQLFGHAYAYVQPSEAEGLPIVVLEAMSYGIPVIVSDIPENLEPLHGAGHVFKRSDARDLARVLEQSINTPTDHEWQAETSRHIIQTEYAWSRIADHTESVYRSVHH